VAISPISAVFAEDNAPAPSLDVKRSASIYDASGSYIGRVYEVRKDKDGAPASVSVIFRQKMVYIPVSTLSSGEKGLVTSLSRASLGK
jgi:hypothetical protein